MFDLLSCLSEYKVISEELLNCAEKEDYDNIKVLLDKREEIINLLKSSEFSSEDFKSLVSKLEIIPLQEKLDLIMNEKRRSLIDKMQGITKNKLANQNYFKKSYEDSLLLYKKI